MAISHFHYLVTTFCLTVWSRSPAVVLTLTWFLQSFMFLCGIATPSPVDYFFWQTLTSCLGALAGITLVGVTRSPDMLQTMPVPHVQSWIRFFIWLAVFIPAQLLFGFFPTPLTPGGLLGTWGIHVVILCIVWVMARGINDNNNQDADPTFQYYAGRRYLFLLWLLTLTIMEMLFFLNYVFTPAADEERWTAIVAGTSGIMCILFFGYVNPLRQAWREPPAPLMPRTTTNNEDDATL